MFNIYVSISHVDMHVNEHRLKIVLPMFHILLLLNLLLSNLNYGNVFLALVEIVVFVIVECVKSLVLPDLSKWCYIVDVRGG